MKKDIILKTHSISIGYKDKKNVKIIASEIDIELEKGKLIALIGVNGIGKSTLLKTITQIQKPLKGTIELCEKNLHEYSNNDLAHEMSVVLTEKLPPSNLSVFELVALGRQPYTNWIGTLTDLDIAQINTAINQTQIRHLIDKKHHQISDGQLQKVLIARALAQDTSLIILDEPTTHLDLLHKYTLLQLLKKLAEENEKCILFSTHDIDLAIQLCDEIIIMTPQKTTQGTPQDLIKKNVFNSIFEDQNIIFDKEKGKFIFKNLSI